MATLRLIGLGFGRAWKARGPVLLIGAFNLALAIIVAAPVYTWFRAHLNRSGDALQLLNGPAARFLFELGRYDRTSIFSLVRTSFFWTAVAGFLIAIFLGAGLFAVVARPDVRPRLPHFFASAARFFPRFLAMAAVVGSAAFIALIAVNVVLVPVAYKAAQIADSESLAIWLTLAQFALSGLLVLYAFLILDYSRVDSVVHPERPIIQALVTAFLLVSRRLVRVSGMAIIFAVLVTLLFGVYVIWRWTGSVAGTPAFLLTLLLQQMVVFGRYGLRAAMIGSEIEFHAAWMPAPVPLPDTATGAEQAQARREAWLYARALRRLAPPRPGTVGALRRTLGLTRRRKPGRT